MKEITNYRDYISPKRQNWKPKGFDFDVDQFENLIDCWTPKDKIPVILKCSYSDLDRFCNTVYHLNYSETYNLLSGITDAYMRSTFKGLASNGNNTAMSIVAKHFMKLEDDEQKASINLTIVNDLKEDE